MSVVLKSMPYSISYTAKFNKIDIPPSINNGQYLGKIYYDEKRKEQEKEFKINPRYMAFVAFHSHDEIQWLL